MKTTANTILKKSARNLTVLLISFFPNFIFATTATISQLNTTNTYAANTNIEILMIAVYANPGGNVTSMTFNTTGTTNVADIANARLWYGTACSSFMSSCTAGGNNNIQMGSTVVSPSGTFTFTLNQAIPGFWTHYFFLTFDVLSTATIGNSIDAECTSYLYSTTGAIPQATTTPVPAGSRTIAAPLSPNIVPNPSFETYTSCPPDDSGDMGRATPWHQPTNGSSDFVIDAPCTLFPPFSITPPPARTGAAIAGFNTDGNSGKYREYIQVPLSEPLIAGHTYLAEMYMRNSPASGNWSTCGTDDVGMYFSSTQIRNPITTALTTYTPQVKTATAVINAASWVLVSGVFVAVGCENYLVIGGFWNNANTTFSGTCAATPSVYYWVDDVSVIDQTGGGGSCNGALSVDLLSFDASCDGNNTVKLQWATASETNNDYFAVERTTDGINYEEIARVDGAGNSSATLNYEFIDNEVSGIKYKVSSIYYRIKQTDFDGKFEYFNPVAVGSCTAFSVFPNPAQNELGIQIFSGGNENIVIEVFDVVGKKISSQSYLAAQGNNVFTLDISAVANGMYILNVITKNVVVNKKFIRTTI